MLTSLLMPSTRIITNNMKYHSPLVTVIVITYNSAKYIRETLDSVKNQTFNDIELIISDDCSTDNTLDIVTDWVEKNHRKIGKHGKDPLIITTDNNGGICHNYNNGLKFAHGKWIKYIAGDDILEVDCISSFVEAAEKCDDKIFICGTKPFTNSNTCLPERLLPEKWFKGDFRSQEKLIVRKGTIIEGPIFFLHRETLLSLNGFEEKYPFIEDYPLYMKFLKNGYRINLVQKCLIRYREYPESVSRSDNRFSKSIIDAIEDFAIPAAWRNKLYFHWYHETVKYAIRHKTHSKIVLYIMSALDIINWRNKIQKKH